MKISYDPKYNIAYIKFRNKSDSVQTHAISGEVNVDVAPDGKIYGIELLNANKQFQAGSGNKFTVTNESTKKSVQIPL